MNKENNIPRGPEDIPLRGEYVKEHYLIISIVDIKNKKEIRKERINYSDPDARRWLGKVTYFSTTNNYEVRTCAEADYVVVL